MDSGGHRKKDGQRGTVNLNFELSKEREICLYDHKVVILF